MNLGNFVKKIQNIMRGDSGINGDAQRIEQLTWMIFLKIYDAKEDEWKFYDDDYQSIIPENLRWKNWAVDAKDGKALTGAELLNFVNNELFPTLKNLSVSNMTPKKKAIVREVFDEVNQYMKDGTLLRQVINVVNEIELETTKDKNFFGDIYETILKSLQSAGNAGEFYTPRAVTDFIIERLAPDFGETVADFACGTGGFLTSTLNYLNRKENISAEQREIYANRSIFGIEKKPLPYLLAVTNMLIHDLDTPNISHSNSLERRITEYTEHDKFPIIAINPPYGGTEQSNIRNNFPADLRSNETADLFIALTLYRLKFNGRAAIIIPDGFLFGADAPKIELKRRLLKEFNLHTIIRLPQSVFAPYTSITTNILFFDRTRKTDKIWFYRVDMPKELKHFSKTKPMLLEHFSDCAEWWNNRREIQDDTAETFKAKCFTVDEIINRGYDLDLCGYPSDDEEILSPAETIKFFRERRAALDSKINARLLNKLALIIKAESDSQKEKIKSLEAKLEIAKNKLNHTNQEIAERGLLIRELQEKLSAANEIISSLNQDIKNKEILIVEKEVEIADRIKMADIISLDRNKQAEESLQRLASKIKVEYLDFMDARDIPMNCDLGENLRLQLQNVFGILESGGIKFK